MAGCWLCFAFWIGGFILILVQKYFIRKQKIEQDRMSMHSTMMGSAFHGEGGSVMGGGGSQFRKDGSMISGRQSFQRGGSMRGSDRSIRSKRDIDDLALSNIISPNIGAAAAPVPTPAYSTSYGRKDIDDMVCKVLVKLVKIIV